MHPIIVVLNAGILDDWHYVYKNESMRINGNKFLVDFGTAKAVLHFQSEADMTFIITEKDGKQTNIAETVSVRMTEIRQQLFMVNWKEKNGTTVTQVQDYEKGVVYSNWTSPDGNFKNLQGILSQFLPITVQTTVEETIETCWKLWTTPADIIRFNNPSDDWDTAHVEIDLKEGGNFFYRMEAKDGSAGFDFAGKYDQLITQELIEYTGTDGRKVITKFTAHGSNTVITEIFEPETATPLEVQRNFCQTILDNFKRYAEKS